MEYESDEDASLYSEEDTYDLCESEDGQLYTKEIALCINEDGSYKSECDKHSDQYVCDDCVDSYVRWMEEDEKKHSDFIDDTTDPFIDYKVGDLRELLRKY